MSTLGLIEYNCSSENPEQETFEENSQSISAINSLQGTMSGTTSNNRYHRVCFVVDASKQNCWLITSLNRTRYVFGRVVNQVCFLVHLASWWCHNVPIIVKTVRCSLLTMLHSSTTLCIILRILRCHCHCPMDMGHTCGTRTCSTRRCMVVAVDNSTLFCLTRAI